MTKAEDAPCGIFDCHNIVGDPMETIYDEAGVRIELCRGHEYFEVFGLTNEEFSEVESFYDLVSKVRLKSCEYANMYGSCLSTACKKVTPTMSEISPVLPDYRIVHRKDGVYDLYDSLRWLMSRGCVDDILNFLSTASKYSAIRIVFEDKSLEE